MHRGTWRSLSHSLLVPLAQLFNASCDPRPQTRALSTSDHSHVSMASISLSFKCLGRDPSPSKVCREAHREGSQSPALQVRAVSNSQDNKESVELSLSHGVHLWYFHAYFSNGPGSGRSQGFQCLPTLLPLFSRACHQLHRPGSSWASKTGRERSSWDQPQRHPENFLCWSIICSSHQQKETSLFSPSINH